MVQMGRQLKVIHSAQIVRDATIVEFGNLFLGMAHKNVHRQSKLYPLE
jgi:hypothetical protein